MLLKFSTLVFLLVLLILFHITPGGFRGIVLLLGSMYFVYSEGGVAALAVLLVISIITYIAGLYLGRIDKNRGILAGVSIAALVLLLFGWKYIGPGTMPIGLSFYTFQAVSYVADVYSRRLKKPETGIVRFFLYMMWFPKWMSGPIERTSAFMKQLETSSNIRFFSSDYVDRFVRSMTYIIWGMFMKLVIADRIGIVVDSAFSDISGCGFITLILASVLYTIQIYCDFAGYTNSMIGVSGLFGIELTQNFITPYLSDNTVEFWRRWHISLSSFLKDYVYIPLGGNRKGSARKWLNTLVVFFICGMWHGAGLTFIVWGLLHGFYNILTDLLKKKGLMAPIKGVAGKIVTFCLVSFAWIFFRAASLTEAFSFIKGMVPFVNRALPTAGMAMTEGFVLGISALEWWVTAACIAILVVMDICSYRKETIPPELVLGKWNAVPRAAVLVALLFVTMIFGKYGAGEEIRSFMYMSF